MIKIDFIKRKYTYILKFSKKKKYSGISFLKTILVIKTLKVLFKRIVIYFKGKYKKERRKHSLTTIILREKQR